MIAKFIFSSFGFGHAKNVKYATSVFKCDFRIWTLLHSPIVPFKLSDIGEGIKEVTVKRSFLKPNQKLSQFEDVCEVESDKASVTITSRFDGLVTNVYFKEGDVIAVGSTLCDIETSEQSVNAEEVVVEEKPTLFTHEDNRGVEEKVEFTHTERKQANAHFGKSQSEQTPAEIHAEKPLATPAVRRIAKDNNVDLRLIKGTGKDGRVMKEDILKYLSQPTKERFTPVFVEEEDEISEPVTGYQKVMVRTMTESNRIPTLGLSDEIDVTDLETLRKSMKTLLSQEDVKLTFLAFLVKAVSLAMARYPILNARFEGDTIKYQRRHNIGIAVDTESGLVVPNIKDVRRLNIRQIAQEVQRLQKLSSQNKLSIADTAYGTFTISNIGSIAGTVAKPLILPPQVAIVGVGRIRPLPRYDSADQLRKRLLVNVSWAADHRIIDGGTTARFSNLVKQYLENPGFLMIDA